MVKIQYVITLVFCLIAIVSCSSASSKLMSENILRSPYDSPAYRPGPGSERYVFKSCPEGDPAMIDFDFHMFYSDPPVNSKIDPVKYADFKSKQRVVQSFAKKVELAANSYLFNKSADGAQCAARLLRKWAAEGALLGSMAKDPDDLMARMQALFVRKWLYGELTNSYLKIRSAPAIAESDKNEILKWFKKIGPEVQRSYLRKNPLTNNHAYWAGVSLITASIALDDRALFDFAIGQYKIGVDQIRGDGTLPQEMARGTEALHYHHWTLTPLSLIATFAQANNVDLWSYRGHRLDLLISLLAPMLKSPDQFARLNGLKPDHQFLGSDSAWTELVNRHTPNLLIKEYLKINRPVEEYWFDFDITAAFGSPL